MAKVEISKITDRLAAALAKKCNQTKRSVLEEAVKRYIAAHPV